ncbi:hypothetical protein FACS1894159_11980 [Bacteroidia bacterium]|nr:hypothetical protein FACS1894159_11980 [Bacteroidia bacterium]
MEIFMKDLTVFVNSSDSYADLWPVFFDLFKMNWPDYDGVIYLNTEQKSYRHEGLNIICTQVGRLSSFGRVFRAGLDMVATDNVLFFMIDYIFMGRVDAGRLRRYYEYFLSGHYDSLCLASSPYYRMVSVADNRELSCVLSPSRDMFSFQAAYWKREALRNIVLPNENPWTAEWYGTKRANKMNLRLLALSENVESPIPYHLSGCLQKGKWREEAVEYLHDIGYNVDFERRGYAPPSVARGLKTRCRQKWTFVRCGLMGSYWDLMRRSLRG